MVRIFEGINIASKPRWSDTTLVVVTVFILGITLIIRMMVAYPFSIVNVLLVVLIMPIAALDITRTVKDSELLKELFDMALVIALLVSIMAIYSLMLW